MWSYASPIAFKIAPASPAILAPYNTLRRKICASYQWIQLPSDHIDNFLCMTLQKTNQVKKKTVSVFIAPFSRNQINPCTFTQYVVPGTVQFNTEKIDVRAQHLR